MMLDDITWNQVDLGRTHTLRNLLPRGFCLAQIDSSAFLFVSAEVLQIDLLSKHVQRWQQRADAPPGPDFHTGRWGVFVHNNTIVAVSNQAAFKLVAHAPLTGPHAQDGEDTALPEFEWQRLPLFGRCWNSTWVPGGVLYNNKVYCFGGFDSDRLWSLDLSVPQLHWVHEPVIGEPPAPRFEHSCAVVTYNGEPHLMIHGGRTTAGILFTDAHLLHLESATWKELQLAGHPLPKTPYGAALAVGDYLYAFGQTLYSKPHALRIDLRRAVCNRLYPWYTPSDNSLGMPCVTLFCRGQAWAFGITAPSAGEDWALSCNTAVLPLPAWSATDHLRFSLAFHATARALVLANAIRHEEEHELDLPADLLGHVLEFLPNF